LRKTTGWQPDDACLHREIWGGEVVTSNFERASGGRCTIILLAMHRTGILAYYDRRISKGPLEGTNNKIRTMQRHVYGFRDLEFFKFKILALHEAK
jgi:hypothetical protein